MYITMLIIEIILIYINFIDSIYVEEKWNEK